MSEYQIYQFINHSDIAFFSNLEEIFFDTQSFELIAGMINNPSYFYFLFSIQNPPGEVILNLKEYNFRVLKSNGTMVSNGNETESF
jgi:hypothetical protein